jgi:hypothetical protein
MLGRKLAGCISVTCSLPIGAEMQRPFAFELGEIATRWISTFQYAQINQHEYKKTSHTFRVWLEGFS